MSNLVPLSEPIPNGPFYCRCGAEIPGPKVYPLANEKLIDYGPGLCSQCLQAHQEGEIKLRQEAEERIREEKRLAEEHAAIHYAEEIELQRSIWIEQWLADIPKTMVSCGVSARFLDARMSDFNSQVCTAIEKAMSKGGVFITGLTGTGKTHLAAALLRKNLESYMPIMDVPGPGKPVEARRPDGLPEMASVPGLLLEIRESFHNGSSHREAEIVRKYESCDLLVLDDLGVEKTSDWSFQTLYLIIDSRYRSQKSTIITSNLDLPAIRNKLTDRIASRIAGMCGVVKLSGSDRRLCQ